MFPFPAKKLSFHWAPFIFPFWAPGSDGWAAAKKLGSHWAPFILPSWAPGSDGWSARPRSWAPVGLPSSSFWVLGRMGGPRKKAGLPLSSLHISFLGSWVGWVARCQEAGLPLGSLHVSFFLGSWVGWVGRSKEAGLPLGSLHLGSGWAPLHVSFFLGPGSDGRQRSFAPIALPSYFFSVLLSRMGGLRPRLGFRLGRGHASFLGSWSVRAPGGWAALTRLAGLHWPPFAAPITLPSCFVFGRLGWMGGPRQKGWAPLPFPSCLLSGFLDGMGGPGLGSLHTSSLVGPRPRSWAPINLPSCFLSGKEAELPLGSLPFSFLGSWVGWVGRCQEAGLALGSLHIFFGLLGRMGGPRPRSWAPVGVPSSSFWVLGRMGGPRQKAGLLLGSLHISFLGSWVGWVARCQEAGLPLGSLHVSFFLGSWVGWVGRSKEAGLPLRSLYLGSHWAPLHVPFFLGLGSDGRQRSFARIGLPSYFLSGLLSRMGGLRPRLGFRWAPFMFPSFWAPGSDGWAAAKKLGSHWAPFIFFGRMGGPRPRAGLPSCFLSRVLGRMGGPRPRG